MYSIHKTKRYIADCEFFKKHDQLAFRKIQYLERIIELDPFFEHSKKERLKFKNVPTYSIRITKTHRLVYAVYANEICVELLSCLGHYEDK